MEAPGEGGFPKRARYQAPADHSRDGGAAPLMNPALMQQLSPAAAATVQFAQEQLQASTVGHEPVTISSPWASAAAAVASAQDRLSDAEVLRSAATVLLTSDNRHERERDKAQHNAMDVRH